MHSVLGDDAWSQNGDAALYWLHITMWFLIAGLVAVVVAAFGDSGFRFGTMILLLGIAAVLATPEARYSHVSLRKRSRW